MQPVAPPKAPLTREELMRLTAQIVLETIRGGAQLDRAIGDIRPKDIQEVTRETDEYRPYTSEELARTTGISTPTIHDQFNELLFLQGRLKQLMESGSSDNEISAVRADILRLGDHILVERGALSKLSSERIPTGELKYTRNPDLVDRLIARGTLGLVPARPTEVTEVHYERPTLDVVARAVAELDRVRGEADRAKLMQTEGTSQPIKLTGDELAQSKQLVIEILNARENGDLDSAVQRAQELAKIQERGIVRDTEMLAESRQAERVQQIIAGEAATEATAGKIRDGLIIADEEYGRGEIISGSEQEKKAAQDVFVLRILKRQVVVLENSGDKQGAIELAQQIEKISGGQTKEDKPTLASYADKVMTIASGETLDNRGKIPEGVVLAISEEIARRDGKPLLEVLQDPKSIRDTAFDARQLKELLGMPGRRKEISPDILLWLEELSGEGPQR